MQDFCWSAESAMKLGQKYSMPPKHSHGSVYLLLVSTSEGHLGPSWELFHGTPKYISYHRHRIAVIIYIKHEQVDGYFRHVVEKRPLLRRGSARSWR